MTLELYDNRYTVESINPKQMDYNANELKELFSRFLVLAGFGPSAIDTEDGGKYEYVDPDLEVVVKREYLDELERKANENNRA